jgi:hypothetical protein
MQFSLERLEPRLLLAAKVRFNDETLTIRLDGEDDDVVITGVAPNRVAVEINGNDLGEFIGIENIKIKNKGGFDTYDIDGVVLGGNIDIKGGGDDEDVTISDSNFAALKLNLGGGDDIYTSGGGNIIHYDSRINMGGGDDEVDMTGGDTLGDNFKINTGGGDDFVDIADNIFVQHLDVDAGGGDDSVDISANTHGDNVKANGGGGEDDLTSDGPGIRRDAKNFETVSA